jgi:hypothetical protein
VAKKSYTVEYESTPAKHENVVEPEIVWPEVATAASLSECSLQDVLKFQPTAKQVYIKLEFHKNTPPSVISSLSFDEFREFVVLNKVEVSVLDYLPSIKHDSFLEWCEDLNFWRWFLIRDTSEIQFQLARNDATNYLLSILSVSDIDPMTGGIDTKLMSTKIRVAQLVLNKQEPATIIQSNNSHTQNNFFAGNVGGAAVSKRLAKESESELEYRLKLLKDGGK